MKRREFITLLGGVAAWPLAARAQQAGQVRRVGIVMAYAKGDTEFDTRVRAFQQELGRLGWTDGGNVQFDERWTQGQELQSPSGLIKRMIRTSSPVPQCGRALA